MLPIFTFTQLELEGSSSLCRLNCSVATLVITTTSSMNAVSRLRGVSRIRRRTLAARDENCDWCEPATRKGGRVPFG